MIRIWTSQHYLYDRCGRKSNCFDRGSWTVVWSDGCRGRWDYSSFPIIVGTVSSVGSSCSNRDFKYQIYRALAICGNKVLGRYSYIRATYLFWLPCTCRNCQRSHPPSGSSPQPHHHHRRHRHWTTTPHPHPTTVHLCDIYRGSTIKYSYLQK